MRLFFIVYFTTCSIYLNAQTFRFIKVINNLLPAYNVAQNADGSFFLATGPPGNQNIKLVKTDNAG